MGSAQASQGSPLPASPHTRVKFSRGRNPLASLVRIRRRIVSTSIHKAPSWCAGSVGGSPELRAGSRLASIFLRSLELPRREAADVDVGLVEPRIVAGTIELNLQPQTAALTWKAP